MPLFGAYANSNGPVQSNKVTPLTESLNFMALITDRKDLEETGHSSRQEGISGKYFSYFSIKTCSGYSLEVPTQGASNEYPQHMFL